MMSDMYFGQRSFELSKVTNNGNSVFTSGGDCKSKSIIYAATCKNYIIMMINKNEEPIN